MSLLDKRVLFVTGKGGTGKTTIAAMIGLWAARMGKKTLIVECNGTQHIGPLFNAALGTYEPTEIHEGLFSMTITSEEAIEDYIVQQIKIRSLYRLVFRNRIMAPFMDAVPGLHDAVHLGKVFDLTEQTDSAKQPLWDLIIVDAPATGHGLNLLASPKSMMDMTQKGPIYEGVMDVQQVIADAKQTGIILTCLPEQLPVRETIELFDALDEHQGQVLSCVLNQMDITPRPEASQWIESKTVLERHPDAAIREAVQWADRSLARQEEQTQAKQTLSNGLPSVPIIEIPLLLNATMRLEDLRSLSQHMADQGAQS